MSSRGDELNFPRFDDTYEELDLNDDIDLFKKDQKGHDDTDLKTDQRVQRDPRKSSSRSHSFSSSLNTSSTPIASSSKYSDSTSGLNTASTARTPAGGTEFGHNSTRENYTSAIIDRSMVEESGEKATGGVAAKTARSISNWNGPLVLGVAVVDFNHLIGPTVEFAHPPTLQSAISSDENLNRLLPFLALPDGAHLSEEDYSYFHCIFEPSSPNIDTDVPTNRTLFGISCNRQLAASDLLRRPSDVTRSMVQKAVIVIASRPIFGPIRDQLGVVTRAYFAQRDFTQTDILKDFYESLELSLDGKLDESAIYMGTSLRELVHKFRHRTLLLLKMLMLQKRIMLYGYPVEMLCTYQYSLVSLIPGLLLSLNESGSPELDSRQTRTRPTSLRTSDRNSLLRYMGLPLHLFGNDAFFQPYLPLQQVDMLKAGSWLVGTTNQIVTQQRDCKYDLLVNIENVTFEFNDSKVERSVGLTPADRRWMDDVVRTVEETWNTPEEQRANFRGSDDDLRQKFEEYICAALASIKYAEFIAKGKAADIDIVGNGNESGANILASFGESWLSAFKATEAFDVWNSCTDPVLFDLCEPRHPCDGKVSVVSDLGLRLAEGMHDLKIDQHLSPTREALSSALAAGSTAFATGSSSLFRAFDGVRNDIATRLKEREEVDKQRKDRVSSASISDVVSPVGLGSDQKASSVPITNTPSTSALQMAEIRATLGGIGTNIGSFFGSRVASLRGGGGVSSPVAVTENSGTSGSTGNRETARSASSAPGLRPMSLMGSNGGRSRNVSGPGGIS